MRLVKPDHTTISYPCLREHPHTCCILVLSRSSSQDPNRPCWYPQASFPAGHPTVSKTGIDASTYRSHQKSMAEFFGGLTFRNSNHQEWLRHWAEASTCNFITVFQSENVTCILPKSSPPQATPHSPRYSDCKSHPKGPPCRAPHSPDDEVFSKDVSFWRFFTDCQCQYLSTSVNHQTKVLLQSHLLHCRCDLCGTAAFASDEVDLVLAFLRGCVEMLAQVIVQQAIPANPIESTVLKIL